MGACQTYTTPVEAQLPLPQTNQLHIADVKPKKYQNEKQDKSPIKDVPQLAKEVRKRLESLGQLDYQKCGQYEHGVQTKPILFPNGTIYAGQWKNGMRHGKGKYYLPDHSFFEGITVNNQIQGYGRLIHANGNYFEGQLKNGLANGKGTYVQGNSTYKGQFKDNVQHGKGFESNEFYQFEGKFEQGDKKKGKLCFKKQKYEYVGEFKHNKYHGHGILTRQNEKYQGAFQKGFKSGHGKLIKIQEYTYEGQFKYDEKHGKGKLFNSAGKLIKQGFWDHNKFVQ